MDLVTKIISAVGGVVGVLAAFSILTGVKDIRSGMATEDPRKTDKGIEAVIIGGVMASIAAGAVTYVLVQLNAIQF